MRFASVDIGSNTTLLLIVEKKEDALHVLADEIYFTRLAEGLSSHNKIQDQALLRLKNTLISIEKLLKKFEITRVSTVATSASREAENKKELNELVKQYLPSLEIITPQREAELTFIGSLFGLGHTFENPLIVDIGGGSTEWVSSNKSYSFPLGSVTLTEKFLSAKALTSMNKKSLFSHIDKELQNIKPFLQEDYEALVFVAGTPVTLAFLEKETFDPNEVHGFNLTKEQVDKWFEKLSSLSLEERKKIPYLPEHRADVILSGLAILKQILEITQRKTFVVSATGVRYGLILESLAKHR